MPIIPMKQTIVVIRKGEPDEFGEQTTPEQRFTFKCRVSEESEVVQNSLGQEVVAGMKILLDKLVDIQNDDTIEYTNELGKTVKRTPIRIAVKRMPNGKPNMTVVYA